MSIGGMEPFAPDHRERQCPKCKKNCPSEHSFCGFCGASLMVAHGIKTIVHQKMGQALIHGQYDIKATVEFSMVQHQVLDGTEFIESIAALIRHSLKGQFFPDEGNIAKVILHKIIRAQQYSSFTKFPFICSSCRLVVIPALPSENHQYQCLNCGKTMWERRSIATESATDFDLRAGESTREYQAEQLKILDVKFFSEEE